MSVLTIAAPAPGLTQSGGWTGGSFGGSPFQEPPREPAPPQAPPPRAATAPPIDIPKRTGASPVRDFDVLGVKLGESKSATERALKTADPTVKPVFSRLIGDRIGECESSFTTTDQLYYFVHDHRFPDTARPTVQGTLDLLLAEYGPPNGANSTPGPGYTVWTLVWTASADLIGRLGCIAKNMRQHEFPREHFVPGCTFLKTQVFAGKADNLVTGTTTWLADHDLAGPDIVAEKERQRAASAARTETQQRRPRERPDEPLSDRGTLRPQAPTY